VNAPASALVVDPRLLATAVVLPGSDPAKLLALLAYGKVSAFAKNGDGADHPEPDPQPVRQRGRPLKDVQQEAEQRCEGMGSLLPPDAPADLLLATSLALTRELVSYAHRLQEFASYLRPDVLVRQVNAHAWVVAEVRRPMPRPGKEPARRGHLLETARAAGASALITGDDALLEAAAKEPLRVVSLNRFVEEDLLARFDFGAVDAPAVIQAAVSPLRSFAKSPPA
jgi:predicted nucleic acid-binding protein